MFQKGYWAINRWQFPTQGLVQNVQVFRVLLANLCSPNYWCPYSPFWSLSIFRINIQVPEEWLRCNERKQLLLPRWMVKSSGDPLNAIYITGGYHQLRKMVAVSFPLSLSLDSESFLFFLDQSWQGRPPLTVLFTLIHAFGIWLTAARLYSQKLTKRLWWDDYAIAISAAFDLGYLPLMWLPYAPFGLFLRILGSVSRGNISPFFQRLHRQLSHIFNG